jgi:hypothetical protein
VPERKQGGKGGPAPVAGLSVLRSGGVGGLLRRRTVDVASLTPDQAQALAALAEAPPAKPAAGADRFSFALTITYADGSSREIIVPEDQVPPSLAGILR